MIQSFIDSWDLFHLTYVAGWLIAIVLSLLGVLVVARDQVFLGASISQASTLGIALAMWLPTVPWLKELGWVDSELFPAVTAVVFSVAAAMISERGGEIGRESRESITGWVFLVSAAGSILVVCKSPHGIEEVHRLVASTIIGATEQEVLVFELLAAATITACAISWRRLLFVTVDSPTAAALGIRVRAWSLAFSAWLGLAVGLAIRSSGMLFTFGALVLPALVAKNICREVRSMFFVAPLVGLGGSALAFVIANDGDYPPGQMGVATLSLLLLIAWIFRRFRRAFPRLRPARVKRTG